MSSTRSLRSPLTDIRPSPPKNPQRDAEVLVYLELDARHAFALAYAVLTHCQRVGAPTTDLQHDLAGLRDFLLDCLDDHHVQTLLRSI